ncbi:hypothetical protein GJAV_G00190240 [Gymnothorax javanicus]|nr:hypothetical protein GJAV_G00190240 [Gymnothorax javanicus]
MLLCVVMGNHSSKGSYGNLVAFVCRGGLEGCGFLFQRRDASTKRAIVKRKAARRPQKKKNGRRKLFYSNQYLPRRTPASLTSSGRPELQESDCGWRPSLQSEDPRRFPPPVRSLWRLMVLLAQAFQSRSWAASSEHH